MNMTPNSPLSPFTGKHASPPMYEIPRRGITTSADLGYVPYMDSWDALRRNLTSLMDAARDGLISGPPGVLQLEALTDIGKSTLYRILDARTHNPTQLDTMEKIASAYNLQVWQLLVPRLDPLDPPVPIGGQRMSVLQSVFAQTHAAATPHAQPSHDGGAGYGARDTGHRARAGRTPADGPAPAPGPKRRPKGRARNKTHS